MAGNGTPTNGNGSPDADQLQYVSISDETRRRYLNYAMSVIMSRALPDVRDGLKPVQRRIMYTMYEDLRLTADAKYRKCAKIVGDTTGNYHPHGTVAVYDAMVRLAQDFTMRAPLVDGQGNFGNLMGLPAAAERYTEARVTRIAERLMAELRYDTVEMRPTYDAVRSEPVVLPAQFPNLLVNGAQGIAVGMATSMPPHHLGEVIKACILLIENPEATVAQVMAKTIKGPDFPLGGRIVTDRKELRQIYEEGRGAIKVRAEWALDKEGRKEVNSRIVIHTIPYGVETGPLVNSLGDIRDSRRLPQMLDVADESSGELGLRIVVHIKPGADPNAVMAYLYKHSRLEDNFAYNATCLIPDEHGALVPKRCDLVEILRHFLDFRLATVRKRFQFLLAQLEKRIHILRGFAIVFDGLDRALKIIRNSTGKQDACTKLMKEFPLDEDQTNAILELQLYRISSLEIGRIREELQEKETEAERIRKILGSEKKLWNEVQKELEALGQQFEDKRRTTLGSSEEIAEFDPQAYIVKENTNIVLSSEAWVRRLGKVSTIDKLRVREGETVVGVLPASTLDHMIFFSSDGIAYTLPVEQIPPSTGYGEPLSKHVKLGDGAGIVSALTTDSRFTPADVEYEGFPPGPYLFVATAQGQVMRIPLNPFRTPSTKSGRKYCRLANGDKVVHVELMNDEDTVFLISKAARLIHFSVADVPILSGAGKGVRGLKLMEKNDVVLGAKRLSRPSDVLKVVNDHDKTLSFGQMKYSITSRGGKGIKTSQRTAIKSIVPEEIVPVDWSTIEGGG
ncbi:DNA gyrase/topoisomerase IV subunit A [Planctomicrobium piriforme]|uniref:DNA topoisomerase (ATP-hydrolyzing) n=1 Tax=Planctomicrobium piriforme TaxID=1576369 RepID=A0A1I3FGN5_9PLAN|nr:DNA topoisomerase (ATP-hydrolyzing) [Planctomicrobium piriforme]SFI10346.1 DNA gyrase subunit A [Planctomicrobium piriforme]